MMEFYDALWSQLAAREAPRPATAKQHGSARYRTALALAAAAVAVTGVVTAFDQSDQELPIFSTAEAGAAEVSALPADVRDRLGPDGTLYPFASVNGRGYVSLSADGKTICMVLPDYIPDSFGTTCAARERVETQGLVASMEVDPSDSHSGVVALLLPAAQDSARFVGSSSGETDTVSPEGASGVVTFPAKSGQLRWTTSDGEPKSFAVRKTAPAGPTIITCADGKPFTIPADVKPEDACAGKGGWDAG